MRINRVARPVRAVEPHEHFVHLPTRLWKLLLAGGLVTWLIAAVVTEVTDDTILVPTVIIVGSFMVPLTSVCTRHSHLNAQAWSSLKEP